MAGLTLIALMATDPTRRWLDNPCRETGRAAHSECDRARRSVGAGTGAVEALGLTPGNPLAGLSGHSVLVTGAHGLLGSWLVKALLEHGAKVVAVRGAEPVLSSLELLGLAGEVSVVHGDICEPGLVARA